MGVRFTHSDGEALADALSLLWQTNDALFTAAINNNLEEELGADHPVLAALDHLDEVMASIRVHNAVAKAVLSERGGALGIRPSAGARRLLLRRHKHP